MADLAIGSSACPDHYARTVRLPSGGIVKLEVNFNLDRMSAADKQFVRDLIKRFEERAAAAGEEG